MKEIRNLLEFAQKIEKFGACKSTGGDGKTEDGDLDRRCKEAEGENEAGALEEMAVRKAEGKLLQNVSDMDADHLDINYIGMESWGSDYDPRHDNYDPVKKYQQDDGANNGYKTKQSWVNNTGVVNLSMTNDPKEWIKTIKDRNPGYVVKEADNGVLEGFYVFKADPKRKGNLELYGIVTYDGFNGKADIQIPQPRALRAKYGNNKMWATDDVTTERLKNIMYGRQKGQK